MNADDAITASDVIAPPVDCEKIREAIVADKGLSLYAQNIEIVAGRGGVTLYGQVKSQEERKRIGNDVASVVKPGKVFDRMVVRGSGNLHRAGSSRPRSADREPEIEDACERLRQQWGI